MPKRLCTHTYESTAVQGEDSFVIITSMKIKEIRAARSDKDKNMFEFGLQVIQEHVLDWNWVDEADEPLPSPRDEPDVVYELTDDEVQFLADLFINGGTEVELKN